MNQNMKPEFLFLADLHTYILTSQHAQAVNREWHRETLFSVPNARNIEMYMDPTQNLLATVYHVIDGRISILIFYLWIEMGSREVHRSPVLSGTPSSKRGPIVVANLELETLNNFRCE